MKDEVGFQFWKISMSRNSFKFLLRSPLEPLLPFTVSLSEVKACRYPGEFL